MESIEDLQKRVKELKVQRKVLLELRTRDGADHARIDAALKIIELYTGPESGDEGGVEEEVEADT